MQRKAPCCERDTEGGGVLRSLPHPMFISFLKSKSLCWSCLFFCGFQTPDSMFQKKIVSRNGAMACLFQHHQLSLHCFFSKRGSLSLDHVEALSQNKNKPKAQLHSFRKWSSVIASYLFGYLSSANTFMAWTFIFSF